MGFNSAFKVLKKFLSLNYERYLYQNKIGRNIPLLKWFIKSVQNCKIMQHI